MGRKQQTRDLDRSRSPDEFILNEKHNSGRFGTKKTATVTWSPVFVASTRVHQRWIPPGNLGRFEEVPWPLSGWMGQTWQDRPTDSSREKP